MQHVIATLTALVNDRYESRIGHPPSKTMKAIRACKIWCLMATTAIQGGQDAPGALLYLSNTTVPDFSQAFYCCQGEDKDNMRSSREYAVKTSAKIKKIVDSVIEQQFKK